MIDVDALRLAAGSHSDGPGPDDPTCELCLFEAYNLLEPVDPEDPDRITDECPADVSPVLHAYGIRLNDVLSDERRQLLKAFLPRAGRPSLLAGTRGDRLDEARGYLALDWMVRTYTPAWLDLAGLTAEAQSLRDLPPIVDQATARADVWAAARADAWSAVRGAVRGAVWDVVGGAVWDVVGDVVGAAARAAARGAATGAVDHAVGDNAAAWDAVGDGAWDIAETAAWSAAWSAARGAARGAAKGAARAALQPVVDQLQDSAVDLYHRMISPQG